VKKIKDRRTSAMKSLRYSRTGTDHGLTVSFATGRCMIQPEKFIKSKRTAPPQTATEGSKELRSWTPLAAGNRTRQGCVEKPFQVTFILYVQFN
jgi:hypothetical protein